MAQMKKLYMGKCLEDLDTHLVLPDLNSRKLQMLLESAPKILREAEKYYKEGDEELAYICYMRYFNLLSCIHKKPEYVQNKQQVRQVLGSNSINKINMDKLEDICKSLNRRYLHLKEEKTKQAAANDNHNQIEYEALSASDKFDRVKAQPAIAPFKSLNLISCKELFHRMQGNNILIMDCRSEDDYNMSHLTYPFCFNVPEEYISAGMSAGKLQDKLDNSSKVLWSARSVKEQVVLMDWNTADPDPPKNTPIGILLDILQNWDPDITYRSPIKILDGGYEYFIMMYPTICTNPSVQAPQKNNPAIDLIEDIEYPSIHDITMKDEIRQRGYSLSPTNSSNSLSDIVTSISPKRPNIDRTSKQAAIKTYNQKQRQIVEIRKEQEKLLEKAEANDAKLQQASKRFEDMFENRNSNNDQSRFTSAEQELIYNIMQLESSAEDYKIENHRLREELERYKSQKITPDFQDPPLSPVEFENLKETTKEIEDKIQEREKLDEKNELIKQQREVQLAIARENKRHMKPPVEEEEEFSKPKIPQFDRSVKPQTITNFSQSYERKRDFSPELGAVGRGLTGLKNLGNTCYMNSILQCLSNTPQLTEYCITDKYRNYISRTNKTKGHIVEEVAALIKVLWNGNYKCVASKDLRYVIGQYQQIFRGIEQQDSHEFLTILMDWLHSDLQTLSVPEKPSDNITASEKAWLEFTKSKESLILHLFYGQIKSTVKCVQCNKESATYECFSNLSLELPSNSNICHLSQCMDMYFSGEHIHGWNCPSCKQKRDAVKKLDISKLPPVLVIHLKRFYVDSDVLGGNSYRKKNNYMRFPLENLDMTPYIARSESRSVTPKTYQLYGVSNHYGSMESGHYTAFCKSGNYGRWFKFDDQVVSQLSTSDVISSAAYILFYTWLPPIQITDAA